MAYDEGLALRIRDLLQDNKNIKEKKMFGGLCFMISGHMAFGIINNELMARVGPQQYEMSLSRAHAKEMDFTGKALRGMIYVAPEGLTTDQDLKSWLDVCLTFISSLPPKN